MKTNAEWRRWGDKDPLFGVAVVPGREKGSANAWTDEEFYALGDEWLDFADRWVRYGLRHGLVVEIGCGAGRMTKRLAGHFKRVIACDVSEGMLRYANQRVIASNIDWQLSDGVSLPADTATVDAVFSCHVLQHLQNQDAQLHYFREIHRVLVPGGTFMIHLPIHTFPSPNRAYIVFARLAYRAFLALTSVKAAIKRARMHLGGPTYMHGISHEMETLHSGLVAMGFTRVEFANFAVGKSGNLHTCVLGTKHS